MWRRKGWAAMDSLRERLEVLKELRDLVRSLGRGGGWGPLRRAPQQVLPASACPCCFVQPDSRRSLIGALRVRQCLRPCPCTAQSCAAGGHSGLTVPHMSATNLCYGAAPGHAWPPRLVAHHPGGPGDARPHPLRRHLTPAAIRGNHTTLAALAILSSHGHGLQNLNEQAIAIVMAPLSPASPRAHPECC